MKYTAYMQSGQYADMNCDTEFEVDADEIEGLDEEALRAFLNDRAVEALCETGLIAIWFEASDE